MRRLTASQVLLRDLTRESCRRRAKSVREVERDRQREALIMGKQQ